MSLVDQTAKMKAAAQAFAQQGKRMGAETVVVELDLGREFEVEVRDGQVENLSESESHGVSVTVSRDRRRASVHSTCLDSGHVQDMIEEAVHLCRFMDEDPFYSLPDPERLARHPLDLNLFDPEVEAMDVNRKIALAREVEGQMLACDSRLRCDGASVSTASSISVLATSQDFCVDLPSTLVYFGVSAFAADTESRGDLNTGRNQSGGWAAQARHVRDLKESSWVARMAARDVLRKLGGRKPVTGRFPVLFEPTCARSLWRHLLEAVSGGNLYRKESYLVDQLHAQVCHPSIQLLNQPHLERGLASRAFDSEGVATREQPIIKDGVLETYLLSTYSANKLNMKTTGHAGGVGNVVVQDHGRSLEDLLRIMHRGVVVTDLSGQGVNLATGDYSRGAQGLWIEGGQVAYPVSEFTINSTLDHIFKHVMHVGVDLDSDWPIQTPSILVGDLSIGGV